jgi:hypothetical protein
LADDSLFCRLDRSFASKIGAVFCKETQAEEYRSIDFTFYTFEFYGDLLNGTGLVVLYLWIGRLLLFFLKMYPNCSVSPALWPRLGTIPAGRR